MVWFTRCVKMREDYSRERVEATKNDSKLFLLPTSNCPNSTRNSQIEIVSVLHKKCKFNMFKINAHFENIFENVVKN